MTRYILVWLVCAAEMAAGGTCLRVVESTLPIELIPELAQHRRDLIAEGWTVETVFTPPAEPKKPFTLHVALAHDVIWPRVIATTNLHVILIGNVPVPSTGIQFALNEVKTDWGCLPCAAYYVLPHVAWSDKLDNLWLGVPQQRQNTPGDGWFDNEWFDGNPDGCIGVVNFGNENPKTWGSALKAGDFRVKLYRDWFNRLHAYRSGAWSVNTPAAQMDWKATNAAPDSLFRSWAESHFGTNGYRFFGPNKEGNTNLFAAAPFGVTWDFKRLDASVYTWQTTPVPWSVLDLSFGSGQCAGDAPRIRNAFIHGALSASSHMQNWDLNGLTSGLTLGETWRNTMSAGGGTGLAIVLLGDPTLRLRP